MIDDDARDDDEDGYDDDDDDDNDDDDDDECVCVGGQVGARLLAPPRGFSRENNKNIQKRDGTKKTCRNS